MHGLAGADVVSVAVTDAQAAEPGGDIGMIVVQRATATATALTVNLTRTGTATAGVDYAAIPASVDIPANATSVQVPVYALDDASPEVPETVIVTVAAGSYTIGTPASGTVTVVDDEPVTVTLSATDASAAEAAANTGTYTWTRTGPTTAPVSVFYTVGGTAQAGQDYAPLSGSITIPVGASTATLVVTPVDDQTAERDETVTVTMTAGAYVIGTTAAVTVTIADNEPVELALAVTDASASEPGTNTGKIQVQRRGLKSAAVTATYAVGGTATPGSDYTALSGTVTLAANATTVDLTITPLTDTVPEGDETVSVTLAAGAGYVVGVPAIQSLTITDDEWSVSVAATDALASEPSGDTGVFTITRSGAGSVASALAVPYSISGTATSGTDFTALSGTATIAANATTTTVTVTPVNDVELEALESVVLTLTPSASYRVGDPATVQIVDNDTAIATVTVATTDGSAAETATDGGVFTVTRTGLLTGALTVPYAVTGTALNGMDVQTLTGSVVIPDGAASATIAVTVLDDAVTEAAETVIVTLTPQTTHLLGATKTGTVTITDNDPQLVTIAATDNAAGEPGSGKGNGTFTLTRQGSPAAALTVNLGISGTAQPGSDYTALATTATFTAGSATTTVSVAALDDAPIEPAETVIVVVAAGNGYTVGATPSATVTVWDDETPEVTIAATDAAAVESPANTGQWTITRRGKLTASLTVPISVSGTATSGSDFTALATSVTIAANAATATLTVTPLNDALVEGDETVVGTIGTGAGFTIGVDASATVVITDDEPSVAITAVDATATVVGDSGTLAITRSGSLTSAVTVNLAHAGTAVAAGDYTALPASVTIPANQRGVVLVVNPLARAGQPASCTVVSSVVPAAGYGVAGSPATVTIRTDLPPVVVVKAQPLNPVALTSITLDASSSTDPNGDALSYYWYNYGLSISVNGPVFTGNLATPGLTAITLVVHDGRNQVTRDIPLTLLTTSTAIGATDTTADDGVLIISGTTVTIDGFHRYLAGRIVNNGVLSPVAVAAGVQPKSLDVAFTDDLTIATGSSINANNLGYARGYTLGNTVVGGAMGKAGGSYGGYGGDASMTTSISSGITNEVYGDFANPQESGSGAGMSTTSPSTPASGGGLIRLQCGSLTNNGTLSANGQTSTTAGIGGGSGGGIRIDTGVYTGTGTITANGGDRPGSEGGGGGGRIALFYSTGTLDVNALMATGGVAYAAGSGTVYVQHAASAWPVLRIDNGSNTTYNLLHRATPVWFGVRGVSSDDPGVFEVDLRTGGLAKVTTEGSPLVLYQRGSVIGSGSLWLAGLRCDILSMSSSTVTTGMIQGAQLAMTSSSTVRAPASTDAGFVPLQIAMSGLLQLNSGSVIDASGCGYVRGRTFGNTMVGGATGKAGGSYGGYGGDASMTTGISTGTTNEVYGDFMNPQESGSGAGMSATSPSTSASGGGLIRLQCGALSHNGVIRANGQTSTVAGIGGGAGGGIRIDTGSYAGAGSITANGGDRPGSEGGGGGGRIALSYATGTLDVNAFVATGGVANAAGSGTIHVQHAASAWPVLRIDNGSITTYNLSHRATPVWFGARGVYTDDPGVFVVDLRTGGLAKVTTEGSPLVLYQRGSVIGSSSLWLAGLRCDTLSVSSSTVTTGMVQGVQLTMTSNSTVRPPASTDAGFVPLQITLSGLLQLNSGSVIDASGCGYVRGRTVGNTLVGGATGKAGGSYGGYGGDASMTTGISTGMTNEVYGDFMNPQESGSGAGMSTTSPSTSASGGGLIRLQCGSLTNNGALRANGQTSTTVGIGGGAGGGIRIDTGAYAGSGTITAIGGDRPGSEGGGGGGRIALFCTTGTVDMNAIVANGGVANAAGPGTVYVQNTASLWPILKIDNTPNTTYNIAHRPTPVWFGVRNVASDDPAVFEVDLRIHGQAKMTTENSALILYQRGAQLNSGSLWVAGLRCDSLTLSGSTLTTASVNGVQLVLSATSAIQPPPSTADGYTPLIVTLSGLLQIDSGCKVLADSCGYLRGYTSGNTMVGGATGVAGGSHGGYGGDTTAYAALPASTTNEVYDDFINPSDAGAGAGMSLTSPSVLANGGGLIRLQAGSLVHNGVISANGQTSTTTGIGGGAGGGIRMDVGAYSGTGTVSAKGGDRPNSQGGGGGGRIAMYFASGTPDIVKFSASGGFAYVASPGTVYLKRIGDRNGSLRVATDSYYATQPLPRATPIFTGSVLTPASPFKCSEDFAYTIAGAGTVSFPVLGQFDADDDGLACWEEAAFGSNPRLADENQDGLNDKIAWQSGIDPNNMDQDGDGVTNADELARGSDPFASDSDADGVGDAVDLFPTDAAHSAWPAPSPTDSTPPIITIDQPSSAVAL